MIKRIEDMNYYEVLEVGPTATSQEIYRSYDRLRKMYDPNSVALYSLFTPEESAAIYRRIEEAYRTLSYDEKRRTYDARLQEGEGQRVSPEIPETQEARQDADQTVPEPREAEQNTLPKATPVMRHVDEFTGPVIKTLREEMSLELQKIADVTKVGIRHLEELEGENFQKLPPRTYIRGFLMLYASALGCDPGKMAADYLKRYDAAMGKKK